MWWWVLTSPGTTTQPRASTVGTSPKGPAAVPTCAMTPSSITMSPDTGLEESGVTIQSAFRITRSMRGLCRTAGVVASSPSGLPVERKSACRQASPRAVTQLRIAYLASMSTGAADRFVIVRWYVSSVADARCTRTLHSICGAPGPGVTGMTVQTTLALRLPGVGEPRLRGPAGDGARELGASLHGVLLTPASRPGDDLVAGATSTATPVPVGDRDPVGEAFP